VLGNQSAGLFHVLLIKIKYLAASCGDESGRNKTAPEFVKKQIRGRTVQAIYSAK
jgi:hypothetical protein